MAWTGTDLPLPYFGSLASTYKLFQVDDFVSGRTVGTLVQIQIPNRFCSGNAQDLYSGDTVFEYIGLLS